MISEKHSKNWYFMINIYSNYFYLVDEREAQHRNLPIGRAYRRPHWITFVTRALMDEITYEELTLHFFDFGLFLIGLGS